MRKEKVLGYLSVYEKNGRQYCRVLPTSKNIHDAQIPRQVQLNRDIKKIYDIQFPCSIFYIDPTRQDNDLRNPDERNMLVIPRNNGTGADDYTISAYLRQRLKGSGKDNPVFDNARIYRIVGSRLEMLRVNEFLESKGLKAGYQGKDPRVGNYPIYEYRNYSRKSGVYAFAYSPDKSIIYVYFKGKKRGWYKYDKKSAPSYVIDEMIQRAVKGWGLNRYINKHPQTYYWKGSY